MLGSKILLFLSGGTVTVGTLGVGINFLLGGGYKDQLNKKVEKVDFRTRTNKSKDSLTSSSVAPFGSLEVEKVTKEIDEDDLDWEYILYYGQDQKKCEFGGKEKERWAPKLGTECTTDWLRAKESQGKKNDNPNSKTDLSIRRKKDFEYERFENSDEIPLEWIDYFLKDFSKENIVLDFTVEDCKEIKEEQEQENSLWKEWKCFLPLPDNKLNN